MMSVICRHGTPNDILAELETSWVKLNYEGDPFEGGPIRPKAARKPVYAPGEITAFRSRLLEALVS